MDEQAVLDYWFGASGGWKAKQTIWFSGDASIDAEIRARFGTQVEEALAGKLDDWGKTPRGALALILLLDQFPRNVFRGTPRAFAGDSKALALVEQGLARGDEAHYEIVGRAFFYMPLEHAEDLSMQALAVSKFAALAAEAPPPLKPLCENFLDYARQHEVIIRRFGRFPHRNAILGRTSTPEESEFLQQPGSSF